MKRILVGLLVALSTLTIQAQQDGVIPSFRFPLSIGEVHYPPIARAAHVTGDVRLSIEVDQFGIIGISVISGHPMLRQKAMEDVLSWHLTRNSQPHKTNLLITYAIDNDPKKEQTTIVKVLAPDHIYVEAPVLILN